jgi:Fe-S cluster biogenesis protein NfuA
MKEGLEEHLRHILLTEIGPVLELDCSAIEVLDVTDGVARVRLGNVCGSCPSTLMYVIHGIERELRSRLPEVRYLEAVP